MASQSFSQPSGRNLTTKVAANAGGKSLGAGGNKGQINGGSGKVSGAGFNDTKIIPGKI